MSKLECKICHKHLSSSAHFEKHMRTIHQPKLFTCDFDGKTFNTKDKLRLHLFNHRKYYRIKCEVCNREYKTNQSMRKHLRTHFQQHQCDHCGQIFKYKRLLENHISAVHDDAQEFQCNFCTRLFPNTTIRDNHQNSIHKDREQNTKIFKCTECAAGFEMKEELRLHSFIHFDGIIHTCLDCNQIFKKKKLLTLHMKKHEMPSYSCEVCKMMFKYKSNLNKHVRKGRCKGNNDGEKEEMSEEIAMVAKKQMMKITKNYSRSVVKPDNDYGWVEGDAEDLENNSRKTEKNLNRKVEEFDKNLSKRLKNKRKAENVVELSTEFDDNEQNSSKYAKQVKNSSSSLKHDKKISQITQKDRNLSNSTRIDTKSSKATKIESNYLKSGQKILIIPSKINSSAEISSSFIESKSKCTTEDQKYSKTLKILQKNDLNDSKTKQKKSNIIKKYSKNDKIEENLTETTTNLKQVDFLNDTLTKTDNSDKKISNKSKNLSEISRESTRTYKNCSKNIKITTKLDENEDCEKEIADNRERKINSCNKSLNSDEAQENIEEKSSECDKKLSEANKNASNSHNSDRLGKNIDSSGNKFIKSSKLNSEMKKVQSKSANLSQNDKTQSKSGRNIPMKLELNTKIDGNENESNSSQIDINEEISTNLSKYSENPSNLSSLSQSTAKLGQNPAERKILQSSSSKSSQNLSELNQRFSILVDLQPSTSQSSQNASKSSENLSNLIDFKPSTSKSAQNNSELPQDPSKSLENPFKSPQNPSQLQSSRLYIKRKPTRITKPSLTSPYQCDLCGYEIHIKSKFLSHIRLHISSIKHKCKECHETFKSMKNLHQHSMKIHNRGVFGSIDYSKSSSDCDICGKTLSSERMKSHMALHQSPKVVCDHCGKVYRTKMALDRHLTVVMAERKFTCSICGKSYKKMSILKQHEETHNPIKIYIRCEMCQKILQMKHLKLHMEVQHGGKYSEKHFQCHCGKEFRYQKQLDKHNEQVHEAKTRGIFYSCNDCDRVFTRRQELRNHTFLHYNGPVFECSSCGLKFKKKKLLYIHSRVHSNDGVNYECDQCQCKFKTRCGLRKHRAKMHNGNEFC